MISCFANVQGDAGAGQLADEAITLLNYILNSVVQIYDQQANNL